MNDNPSYVEYSVTKKYEGSHAKKAKTALTVFIAAELALLAVLIVLFGYFFGTVFFVPTTLVSIPVFIIFYNRAYKLAFDYRIAEGELNIAKVINRRSRRDIITLKLKCAELIVPYEGGHKAEIDKMSFNSIFNFTSSDDSPDIYAGVFGEEHGEKEKTLIFFEPSEKMLSAMGAYCRRALVRRKKQSGEQEKGEE